MHAHGNWRHLQRAAVVAHKNLANVPQADFCALLVPAASIALWILQQAPHLAQRGSLHILIAQASEYEALDSGRWLQFIPWLLGRPAMHLEVSLVGDLGLPGTVQPTDSKDSSESGIQTDAAEHESEIHAKLAHRLQSRSWVAVKSMPPADLHIGTVGTWSERVASKSGSPNSPRVPDLCVVFSPILSMKYNALLSEDGLLPLLRAHVPMAFFSSSEAEHLVDVYVLEAAGLQLKGSDYWPNPWALPTPGTDQRGGVHAKMAWAAEVDHVPAGAYPDQRLIRELGAVLEYIDASPESGRHGSDAILSIGERLRAAAPSKGSNPDPESVSVLIRLTHDMAVDSAGGHIYQIQDYQALLVDIAPVPASVLDAFPGNEELLLRAIWATAVHRDHVAPYTQHVDAALASHFSALDEGGAV